MTAELKVTTVGQTWVNYGALRDIGYTPHFEVLPEPADDASDEEWDAWEDKMFGVEPIDELHEAAGRRCYNSWHRPRKETAENADYLRKSIIDSGHFSVLAHGHVTLHVEGVSRALLLELERHQKKSHLNFSVVSQRYVDHSKAEFVVPPLLEKHLDEPLHNPPTELRWTVRDELEAMHEQAQDCYGWLEKFMERKGYGRKEIRGAARAVLPENTETKFFVTASIRGWRDVLEQRLPETADEEIREFAMAVLKELVKVAPNSVQDFTEEYLNGESK